MRVVLHPLLERDIVGIAEHVHAVSGDAAAARRRIVEVRDLIAAIVEEPALGTALGQPLAGWRVRHGGGGRRITVVFRHDAGQGALYLALVAFGGQDWEGRAAGRWGPGSGGRRTAVGAALNVLGHSVKRDRPMGRGVFHIQMDCRYSLREL